MEPPWPGHTGYLRKFHFIFKRHGQRHGHGHDHHGHHGQRHGHGHGHCHPHHIVILTIYGQGEQLNGEGGGKYEILDSLV